MATPIQVDPEYLRVDVGTCDDDIRQALESGQLDHVGMNSVMVLQLSRDMQRLTHALDAVVQAIRAGADSRRGGHADRPETE